MSKLYVGNLPRSITESALEELFTSAQYQVQNIKLVRDMDSGLPRGFAFVELAAGMDLQKAIQELNGHAIEGRQLVINEARPQAPRPGGGGRGFGSGQHQAGVVALVEAEEEAGMDVEKVDVVAAARDIEVTRDLTTSLKRMRPSWRKFKPEKA